MEPDIPTGHLKVVIPASIVTIQLY